MLDKVRIKKPIIFFEIKCFIANGIRNIFNISKSNLKNEFKNSKVLKHDPKTISLENLHKVYSNGIKAIDNQSLNINSGEFLVLLGPSGCGKTTILRMIAGLESVSDGYIKINNVIMNSVQSKDREIAMVFQNYALYPFMTVFKNISFGLKNKTYKNIEYLNIKNKIKNVSNPYYSEIKENKVIKKILSSKDPVDTDKLNRLKRLLSVAKRKKDSKEISRLRNDYLKIKNKISERKNSIENKKEVKKIEDKIKYFKSFNKNKFFKEINDLKDELHSKSKTKEEKSRLRKKILILKKKNIDYFENELKPKLKKLIVEKYKIINDWKSKIPIIIEDVTKMLGINMYTKRKPAELSGGQRQRVALARAISKESGLFLYDEPLSNLDAKLRSKMRTEIKKIHNLLRATSVYVTHDQVEAMSMADKIVVMNKGYIQQIGTPKELLEKPANLFVSKFIGNTDINIFPVKHIKGLTFSCNGNKIFISTDEEKIANMKRISGDIVIGVRPEHIIIDSTVVDNFNENRFSGKVEYSELLGNDVLLTVKSRELGNVQIISKLAQNIQINDEVKFVIDPNKINLYDKKTGFNVLIKLSSENHNARKVWLEGVEERKKNIYLMNKEKNKLSLTELIRTYVISIFSKSARKKLKERKKEINYGDQISTY